MEENKKKGDISTQPENVLTFCPRCGKKWEACEQGTSFHCSWCEFVMFLNSATAVAGIITSSDGKLLFCRRAEEPMKGKLDFPGGFVSPSETAETALKRELSEELGAVVTSFTWIGSFPNTYVYKGLAVPTLDLAFAVTIREDTHLCANDDVEAICWLDPQSVLPERVAFPSVSMMVDAYLQSFCKR